MAGGFKAQDYLCVNKTVIQEHRETIKEFIYEGVMMLNVILQSNLSTLGFSWIYLFLHILIFIGAVCLCIGIRH